MDVFAMASTIWRNKIVAIPVLAITLIAVLYVVAVKPATYTASASVLLAGPPAAPTKAQLAVNPKLANLNPNNPFLSYGSLIEVADISIELLSSPASQQAMTQGGKAPQYKASLSTAYGIPPIINIVGTGSTSAQAVQSTTVVVKEVSQNLYQIQAKQGVNPYYMIKIQSLVAPVSASKSNSAKLRSAIGYFAVGLILLLILVSISEAMRKRRRDSGISPAPRSTPATDSPRLTSGADEQRPSPGGAAQRRTPADEQRRYSPEFEAGRRPQNARRNGYSD
jgi:hypothetical protein